MIKKLALAAAAAVFGVALNCVPAAHADTPNPVVTVANAPEATVGAPLTFTVAIDQPGYTVNQASAKITWTKPGCCGATLNVANYTVLPMTYDAEAGAWRFTYTPGLGEQGRLERFSVTVNISQARIPKTVMASGGFKVGGA